MCQDFSKFNKSRIDNSPVLSSAPVNEGSCVLLRVYHWLVISTVDNPTRSSFYNASFIPLNAKITQEMFVLL